MRRFQGSSCRRAGGGSSSVALLLAGLTLSACNFEPQPPGRGRQGEGPGILSIDLERMIRQARFSVWQESDFFADGKVMRHPPEGTVPFDAIVGDPALTEGIAGGLYVTRIPVPVTAELLRAGRNRFEVLCAACHGIAGDGMAQVAANMTLRKPPDLTIPPVTEFPPGRMHQVIVEGYGLMRSYQEDLPGPVERWSVVAYVQALQRSRGVPLTSLPPALRERALEALQ